VSLLEAMSCERPIVAPRLGCIPEILSGDVGRLVEPHDATALAAEITAMLRDPEHGAEARRRGRLRVMENWSLASMVDGYEELIRTTYDRKTQNRRA
jgi:glycosyltransferase involved in cell wall biosynthesis